MSKIDERDIMFARMNYTKNSQAYREYYNRNPEKQAIDERLKSLPGLSSPDTKTYDPLGTSLVTSNFKLIDSINHLAEGAPSPNKIDVSNQNITEKIKKMSHHFGASLVGITSLTEDMLYSHRGRNEKMYGQEVHLTHNFLIIFAMEMDSAYVNRAPHVEQTIEVTQRYLQGEMIALQMAYFIRELGYDARAHIDGNYLLYLPAAAQQAGLGQFGRNNILVTPKYGPRIRFSAVSTTLPLKVDQPLDFGLKNLCDYCGICEKNCPGNAMENPIFSQEKCFEVWQRIGTDCGVCLSSCPLAQPLSPELWETFQKHRYLTEELSKRIVQFHKKHYKKRNYNPNKLSIL